MEGCDHQKNLCRSVTCKRALEIILVLFFFFQFIRSVPRMGDFAKLEVGKSGPKDVAGAVTQVSMLKVMVVGREGSEGWMLKMHILHLVYDLVLTRVDFPPFSSVFKIMIRS